MTATVSLLLGALLGAAHAAAALVVARRARSLPPTEALRVVMRAMLVRMAAVLAVFAAVLAWVPVERGAFVLGLGVTFVAGLVGEALTVLRRPSAA